MSSRSHGFVGSHLSPFTELLPGQAATFATQDLNSLASQMVSLPDTPKDGPDPEENLWVPAGYTYFGQFVDHDLTFDSTSSLNLADRAPQGSHVPSNLRTPRFDLDNVYGDGPDAQPFMYDAAGLKLLVSHDGHDLARASNGRAIIGDKRNDENSIVCQIQLGMIRYHNAVVDALAGHPEHWTVPDDLFASAQNEVRWTYQRIIIEDFLPRIVDSKVFEDLALATDPVTRRSAYVLYTDDKRANLPREFVGAAYRFGHSGVRQGYRLSTKAIHSIFAGSNRDPKTDAAARENTLLGFDPLPKAHVVDSWERFFPDSGPGADIHITGRKAAKGVVDNQPPILQYAYKIDTTLVDPLSVLPQDVPEPKAVSEAEAAIAPQPLPHPPRGPLALLNLLRGNFYGLASGQSVAEALNKRGRPVTPLTEAELVVRVAIKTQPGQTISEDAQAFQWQPIAAALRKSTPLWFYVLAEAQAPLLAAVPGRSFGSMEHVFSDDDLLNGPGALTQLGGVGGRIIAEVFFGLLDADPRSVSNDPAAKDFKPRMAGNGRLCMRNLLDFGGGAPSV